MAQVRERAMALPTFGVRVEILKFLPCDDNLDKFPVQKAATLVVCRSNLVDTAQRLAQLKPNGVVLEKSSFDDADVNAQRIASLRQCTLKLQ